MKLYTLNNEFIKEVFSSPEKFTGIVEYGAGSKEWRLNGVEHRLEGPAIEWIDGTKEYFIYGKRITKEQHKLYVDILKLKGLL